MSNTTSLLVSILALAALPTSSCRDRTKLTPPSQTASFTARDVGEYANVPWVDPSVEIVPGSREDRVRDLNFSLATQKLANPLTEAQYDAWAARALLGRSQGKKLLLQLYFWNGDDRFTGPLLASDEYLRRITTFLNAMQARDALDAFAGFVLAEENLFYTVRPILLADLYWRIRAKYDVAIWQWWSPPLGTPASAGWVPADGWVIDPYFMPEPGFRQYIRNYVAAGVPVVLTVWASSELESRPPLTAEQWDSMNHHLDTAVEFNLPVVFFWTFRTGTHFGGDRNGGGDLEIDEINRWAWNYIERVRALPPDYAGLPTADTQLANPVRFTNDFLGVPWSHVDDFSTLRCLQEATFTSGFRDCVMNSDTLATRGYQGRDVDVIMTYRFLGNNPASYPRISLDTITQSAHNGRVELAISLDGITWTQSVAASGGNEEQLILTTDTLPEFSAINDFFVRIRMTGGPGTSKEFPTIIDNFKVSAAVN